MNRIIASIWLGLSFVLLFALMFLYPFGLSKSSEGIYFIIFMILLFFSLGIVSLFYGYKVYDFYAETRRREQLIIGVINSLVLITLIAFIAGCVAAFSMYSDQASIFKVFSTFYIRTSSAISAALYVLWLPAVLLCTIASFGLIYLKLAYLYFKQRSFFKKLR